MKLFSTLAHRFIFFSMLVFLCNCSSSDAVTENDDVVEVPMNTQPNILLIIADDMGLDATPNYLTDLSIEKPTMPTLSSLMSEGLVFDNLWSYSLCTPTRSSILTGKHGINTAVLAPGDHLSTSEKSLHTMIDEKTNNGYAHGVFGKWHLSATSDYSHPTNMGVGTYAGNLSGGLDIRGSSYWNYDLVENEAVSKTDVYSTTKYTDLAIEWKDKQTKPWFLWLAYNAAHTPFHKPDNALHSRDDLPEYVEGQTDPLPYYLAMLEAMDTEIGRLLDSMPDEERNNTIVIFIGDNGSPGKVSQYENTSKHRKGSVYQGGINVPMVISGPSVRGGRETALVQTSDLFTTILELTGADMDSSEDSKSFQELLFNASAEKRSYVYSEVPGGNDNGFFTVRNDSYKLIYEIDTGNQELYNLIADPYEKVNLLASVTLTSEEAIIKNLLLEEGKRVRGE